MASSRRKIVSRNARSNKAKMTKLDTSGASTDGAAAPPDGLDVVRQSLLGNRLPRDAVPGDNRLPAGLTREQWARAQRLLGSVENPAPVGRARALDRLVAAAGLAATAPLLALSALLVQLESPGPILVRQVRIGAGGRPFTIFKLRTMRRHAADLLRQVAAADNVHARLGDARMFKAYADPRVLRVGAVLRAFALDELPQLLNVMRGEMELVGPRPLTPDEDRWVDGPALVRRAVPPGMTGLWQVLGGNDIAFARMVQLDVLYVERRSLRQDARLLAATPRAVLRGVRRWREGCTG
jgi:lipopolysaccharide/colanic/teichoic acid biosynthesis glycosyltransferase